MSIRRITDFIYNPERKTFNVFVDDINMEGNTVILHTDAQDYRYNIFREKVLPQANNISMFIDSDWFKIKVLETYPDFKFNDNICTYTYENMIPESLLLKLKEVYFYPEIMKFYIENFNLNFFNNKNYFLRFLNDKKEYIIKYYATAPSSLTYVAEENDLESLIKVVKKAPFVDIFGDVFLKIAGQYLQETNDLRCFLTKFWNKESVYDVATVSPKVKSNSYVLDKFIKSLKELFYFNDSICNKYIIDSCTDFIKLLELIPIRLLISKSVAFPEKRELNE